ncbi:MAG: cytochrome c oxidase assembly protein [Solirubrobacterales bacterium]
MLALLLVAGAIYAWRFAVARSDGVNVSVWRAVSFAAGLLVIAAALLSPIDYLAEHRLFSVHMVQHLMLVDVASILLLLGLNRAIMRPAVRRLQPVERRLGWVAHPATALVALVAVLWAWHVPALYDLALRHAWAHSLEHLTFMTAGLAFWWYLIEPVPARHRLSGPGSVAYIGAAKMLLGVLGVALAFATTVWYSPYEHVPRAWGLSPLTDQNIGGVLMMIEQSVVLIVFFAIMFIRMLERSEQAQQREERYGAAP